MLLGRLGYCDHSSIAEVRRYTGLAGLFTAHCLSPWRLVSCDNRVLSSRSYQEQLDENRLLERAYKICRCLSDSSNILDYPPICAFATSSNFYYSSSSSSMDAFTDIADIFTTTSDVEASSLPKNEENESCGPGNNWWCIIAWIAPLSFLSVDIWRLQRPFLFFILVCLLFVAFQQKQFANILSFRNVPSDVPALLLSLISPIPHPYLI